MKPLSDQHESLRRSLHRWRSEQLEAFEPQIRELVWESVRELDETDYVEANRFCRRLTRALEGAHVGRAYDEEELRACADNFATTCSRIRGTLDPRSVLCSLAKRRLDRFPGDGGPEIRAFAAKCCFAATVGLKEIPANRTMRFHGLSARLDDPLWWRRQLRKTWSRRAEQSMRELGLIRRGREVYCSQAAVRMRADQQRRIRRFTDDSVAVNELGESLELSQIVERSLANPTLRRGELMTRARGFDELAQELGHEGVFVTLTCPSKFHAQLAWGGPNPRYGGSDPEKPTVRDAQRWLSKVWSRMRARFAKASQVVYGMRVAEPHHDSTPHWHCLLYARKVDLPAIAATIQDCALQEFGDEPGAYEKRVCLEAIDWKRGTGVGYLAKYIAKGIDGHGVIGTEPSLETGVGAGPELESGLGVKASLSRVKAWASLHHIRQFQQLGGPAVGIYRELRRLREAIDGDYALEAARSSADRGDWAQFCRNTQFPFNPLPWLKHLRELWRFEGRGRLPPTSLRLWKEETGQHNRYGEACGAQIVGIRLSSNEVPTRPHRWKIERKQLSASGGANNLAQTGSVLRDQTRGWFSLAARGARLGPVALTVTPDWERQVAVLRRAKLLNEQVARQKPREIRVSVTCRSVFDAQGQPTLVITREYATGPPH